MDSDLIRLSKFLSLILRHKPEKIGLAIDKNGWANIDDLVRSANRKGYRITRQLVKHIVAENDKNRYAISEDGKSIRASQGHSIEIDLGLQPTAPPELLYHGTALRFIESIRAKGLISGNRQNVHLSNDILTATKVGQRHGRPIILVIRAHEMHTAGFVFFVSANGVWLTERVPVQFINFP